MRFSFCASPAMIFQSVDGFLDLGRRHFVQPGFTEFPDQISTDLAIAFESLGCAAATRVLLQPVSEILREWRPGTFGLLRRLVRLLSNAARKRSTQGEVGFGLRLETGF